MNPRIPIAERFSTKVQKSEDCWAWIGCRTKGGYGLFLFNGKTALAHRVSYQLANGPIPDGLVIRHTCDNPQCVRPEHLITGTHTQNAHDRKDRGRSNGGMKPQTHCRKGHLFTVESSMLREGYSRTCRICFNARQKEYLKTYRAKQREGVAK